MCKNRRNLEGELSEVHARLRKDLDEVAAIRPQWSIEAGAKWRKKIQSVSQEMARANAIVATGRCSFQQLGEHFKFLARMQAVVRATFEGYSDSLESGQWAIVLASEEFKRRWGAPTQPEGPSR